MSFREIGELTHMTGQAVGVRVNKLIDSNIIEKYTVKINKEALGYGVQTFIKIYMKSFSHKELAKLFEEEDDIIEAYKVSSDACYIVKVETKDLDTLNILLEKFSRYGNYQVNTSINKVK